MNRLYVVLATALLLPAVVRADSAEEIRRKIIEDLKPFIEQEVQRRVKEALAAQTAAAPVVKEQWSPAQPITVTRAGPAYMNVSFVADTVFGWSTTPAVEAIEGAHHDPSQRGFSLTGAELVLDGAVDPYFKGLATITLVVEPGGETAIELEEAWLQTTSLPANLQLKAGQFFANLGRQNTQHAHAWAFVDQPIVITRLLGADGLRNPGAQLSWLVPTPFYSEVMLGVFNSDGETVAGFRSEESGDIHGGVPVERNLHGPQDLLFVPRVATAFDLTDTQTLLLGASAAFGPNNSGPHADTQIYGVDAYWKWRPVDAEQGFPFVSWQTEALLRQYEAEPRLTPDDPPVALAGETLNDWGFYSQLLYGFARGWVAGLRGEFVSGDTAVFASELRLDRTRLSPNLTLYPTEFSKIRLQYNYDHLQSRLSGSDEHSVWLQLEFLLGAHAAHKF